MRMIQLISVSISIMLSLPTIGTSIAQAQSTIDVEPPVIELEELTEGTAGETQVFTALVVDDKILKDVKLYYRFSGQQPFTNINMSPLADTGYFTARIATVSTETRALEYYIQARDEGGNRVVQGYAFDPLIRQLNPPASPLESLSQQSTPAESTEKNVSGFKWWYVALGVLAAGAIAGAAGGGDNSTGSSTQVPINVTIGTPEL